MSIFVDTGAWYAVLDRSDRHHDEASRFYLETAGTRSLVTSDLVLAETWSLVRSRLDRQVSIRFWESLRETRVPILTLERADLEAAWRILQAFPDQDFSLTDCTSFALMERLGIEDAFAFDEHFLIYRYGSDRQRAFRRQP